MNKYRTRQMKTNMATRRNLKSQRIHTMSNKRSSRFRHKYCLCILCRKPNDIYIDFLSTFIKYDIYIIIDDNSICYKEKYAKFSNINIIQINNEECKKRGFKKMTMTLHAELTAWDKAMYYFSTLNTIYNKVWFMEDDVFFYNEETLLNIDSKYKKSDLLTNNYTENKNGDKKLWYWNKIDIKFPSPYYCAMACATRISSALLSKIKAYADEHNTLFFIEALFPTICKINNMKYDTPAEFKNIVHIKNYHGTDFNKYELFHPVKDIRKQKHYRDILSK